MVCVIHPVSGDEFHLPGRVVKSKQDSTGVAVAFASITAGTQRLFHRFIALGIPTEGGSGGGGFPALPPEELALVHVRQPLHKTEEEADDCPRDTAPIDMSDVLPFLDD